MATIHQTTTHPDWRADEHAEFALNQASPVGQIFTIADAVSVTITFANGVVETFEVVPS